MLQNERNFFLSSFSIIHNNYILCNLFSNNEITSLKLYLNRCTLNELD